MTTFEVYGIVKSKGKKIAVGDNGVFSTDNEKTIKILDELGFKRINEPMKEITKEEKIEGISPKGTKSLKKKVRPKKVKE
jgi:hypothetical protein